MATQKIIMIKRLTFSVFGLLLTSLACAQTWDFDVSMDGKPIGEHQFVLSNLDNGDLQLASEAKFNVKFLSINVFKYHHQANEVWSADCLKQLDAKTQENSKKTLVTGVKEQSLFKVNAQKPLEINHSCVMTFAYWNPKILQQKQLLNPQTGEYLASNTRYIGKETILVKGQTKSADHYKIDTSKFKIDIWYSAEGEWLALQSQTPDGRIDYALK
jgi:hypothetical protein